MKDKIIIALTSISLLTLLFFTGCAKYNADTLPLLQNSSAQYSQTEKEITVYCKAFTTGDCMRYLDRNVLKEGYQPIQISIQNDSDHVLYFSQEGFGLPTVAPESVAKKVHTSTIGRAAGWGVGGLFIWPLFIPAIVDGIGSANANVQLDRDFAEKTMRGQPILPHTRINGLVFVPKPDFKENFTISLQDQSNEEKINFQVGVQR